MEHTETKQTIQDLVCQTIYARDFVVGRTHLSWIPLHGQARLRPVQRLVHHNQQELQWAYMQIDHCHIWICAIDFELDCVYSISGASKCACLRTKRELHVAMCAHLFISFVI
jgi:hypothetical protein